VFGHLRLRVRRRRADVVQARVPVPARRVARLFEAVPAREALLGVRRTARDRRPLLREGRLLHVLRGGRLRLRAGSDTRLEMRAEAAAAVSPKSGEQGPTLRRRRKHVRLRLLRERRPRADHVRERRHDVDRTGVRVRTSCSVAGFCTGGVLTPRGSLARPLPPPEEAPSAPGERACATHASLSPAIRREIRSDSAMMVACGFTALGLGKRLASAT